MDKEFLKECLLNGDSTRDIENKTGIDHRKIAMLVKKFELQEFYKHKKNKKFLFEKIDSKEKAYSLGFILADGHIGKDNVVEITTSKADREVVEYIASVIFSNVFVDDKLDKKKRRFPSVSTHKKITDVTKFTGGRLKAERHYPRVREDLERYLIQGLFDADGCITWGRRKDKNRIWQKVCFTSQLNILSGVQQYLINKLQISTTLRPKSNENCFVLEFSNRNDVLKFLNHIYPNDSFIILSRKYAKYKALRLELEENGESTAM